VARGNRFLEPPRRAEVARPRLRLLNFKPVAKNSLRGFAAVELPIGLRILDIPVLVSHGKVWAALPGKPQLDQDGRHKRDANGKAAYSPVLEWKDRDLANRFSDAVVELVRAAHPGDLKAAGLGHQADAPPPGRRSLTSTRRRQAAGPVASAPMPNDSVTDLWAGPTELRAGSKMWGSNPDIVGDGDVR
jgi:hypothetical protein